MTSVATDRLSGISTSVALKAPVKAVSSANLTLSGLQTVGGVALVEGDRVLVKDQSDNTENGIYDASSSDWTRSKDFDGNRDAVKGTLVVTDGVSTALLFYRVTTANPVIIGTSALTFEAASEVQDPYPQTAAELSASVTPTNLGRRNAAPYDLRRVGLIANDSSNGTRTANTAALQALFNPDVTGPTGKFVLPNESGADTYYFNGIIPFRQGVHILGENCRLHFAKTYASGDDHAGFLYAVRDFHLEWATVEIDYNGTGGTNAGSVIRFGNRKSDGAYFPNSYDSTLSVAQKNLGLSHVKLITNNPGMIALQMTGGLRHVECDDVEVDGGGVAYFGGYYEFGIATNNADPVLRETSHATGMVFRNWRATNMDVAAADGAALALIGSYGARVENLYGKDCYRLFQFRPGEALFYRPWTDVDTVGAKRIMELRGLVGQNIIGTGCELKGAESASTGYLASAGLTEAQQTDLMRFDLCGFAIKAAGAGINVSGTATIRDGDVMMTGGADSGALIIQDECTQFEVEQVGLQGSAHSGIRAGFGGSIHGTPRLKTGLVRECVIGNNTGPATSWDNADGVQLINNRLGFNSAYDGANESNQTYAVSVSSGGKRIICDGNLTTMSGGAQAYRILGTGSRGCKVMNPKGTVSYSGTWGKGNYDDFVSSANIALVTHQVNATYKYDGQTIWDTSNNRAMVALGAASTSDWRVIDGSASVTPTT